MIMHDDLTANVIGHFMKKKKYFYSFSVTAYAESFHDPDRVAFKFMKMLMKCANFNEAQRAESCKVKSKY